MIAYHVGQPVIAISKEGFGDILPGTIGIVESFDQDPKTGAFKDFVVNFGFRKGQAMKADIVDLTTIKPVGKEKKSK